MVILQGNQANSGEESHGASVPGIQSTTLKTKRELRSIPSTFAGGALQTSEKTLVASSTAAEWRETVKHEK